jgi:hypothetical protein
MTEETGRAAKAKYFPWWLLSGALLTLATFVLLLIFDRAPTAVSSLLVVWFFVITTWRAEVRSRIADDTADSASVVRRNRRLEAVLALSWTQLTIGLGLLLGFLTPARFDLSAGQAVLGAILTIAGALVFLCLYVGSRRRSAAAGESP